MKDYKERAWNDKLKCFHYSTTNCYVVDDGQSFMFMGNYNKHPDFFEYDNEELKIDKSIGIKDIHGNMIFENDKIKIIGDEGCNFSRFDGWIISLKEPLYILLVKPNNTDAIPLASFEYHGRFEIIGNIYEN